MRKLRIFYNDYGYAILIGRTRPEIETASKICAKLKIKLIVSDCMGVFSRVFCDYGKEFIVFDKNGEEAQETMIKSIEVENEERVIVTLLPGAKADYEDGDKVLIERVEGMELEGAETTEI